MVRYSRLIRLCAAAASLVLGCSVYDIAMLDATTGAGSAGTTSGPSGTIVTSTGAAGGPSVAGSSSSGSTGVSGVGGAPGTGGGAGSTGGGGATGEPDAGHPGEMDAGGREAGPVPDGAPAGGALATAVGSFVKVTGRGPQVIPHSLGTMPAMLLLWTSGKTSSAPGADYLFAMGSSDAPMSSMSAAMASRDAAAAPNTSRRMARKALTVVEWDQVTLAEADLTAWDSTTFSLDWATNNDVPYVVHYVVLGGTGVKSKVVRWQTPTAPGPKSVVGVGFRPDAVLHFYIGAFITAPSPYSEQNAAFGLGAMDEGGAEWATHVRSTDAKSPSSTGRFQALGSSIYMITETPALTKDASFASMDADGFTVNFKTANSSPAQVFSLALGGVRVKAGAFTKAAGDGPGAQSVTGTGFRPGLVLLSSVEDEAETGIEAPQSRYAFGASDGAGAACTAIADTNGVTPTSARAVGGAGKTFLKVNGAAAVGAEAGPARFDPDGFTLDWTTNDSAATQICYLAFGPR